MSQGVRASVRNGDSPSIPDLLNDGRSIFYDAIGATNSTEIAGRQTALNAKEYTPTTSTTLTSSLALQSGVANQRFSVELADSDWLPLFGTHNVFIDDGSKRVLVLLSRKMDGSYEIKLPQQLGSSQTYASGATVEAVYAQGTLVSNTIPAAGGSVDFEQGNDNTNIRTGLWPAPKGTNPRVLLYAPEAPNGIEGKISFRTTSQPFIARFQPSYLASPITIADPRKVTLKWLGDSYNDVIHLFWLGRNGVEAPNVGSPYAMNDVEVYNACISRIVSVHPKFLILSIFNGTGESSGSSAYNTLVARNQSLAAAFPDNYYDVRRDFIDDAKTWFAANYPSDYATAWTSDSDDDVANDIVPRALRMDTIHLNNFGNHLFSTLVAAKLQLLKW